MPRSRFSDAERADLIARYRAGATRHDLAAVFGVSLSTVRYHTAGVVCPAVAVVCLRALLHGTACGQLSGSIAEPAREEPPTNPMGSRVGDRPLGHRRPGAQRAEGRAEQAAPVGSSCTSRAALTHRRT